MKCVGVDSLVSPVNQSTDLSMKSINMTIDQQWVRDGGLISYWLLSVVSGAVTGYGESSKQAPSTGLTLTTQLTLLMSGDTW